MKWVLKCSNRANCKFAQDDRWLESGHYVLKYDRKRKRMFPASDEEVRCPVCGEPLRWEEQTVPISDFGVSTFNGLSDEAKKKVFGSALMLTIDALGMTLRQTTIVERWKR